MTRVIRGLALIAMGTALTAARPAAQTVSLKSDFLKDWAAQKDTLAKIAAAMPEDK